MKNGPRLPSDVEATIKPKKQEAAKPKAADPVYDGNGKKRWENRRRMAWSSLLIMMAETVVLIYIAAFTTIDMDRLKAIAEPLGWSYVGFMSVIGAYMGFTTWASKR